MTDEMGDYTWMSFTKDTPEADAVQQYRRRYGKPPEKVFVKYGLLMVGPVEVKNK